MSLVKYGGGIIQMSGSIAGNVYARNKYGNYVRARTTPKNDNTPLQNAVRAVMAQLAEKWSSGLDAAERTAWDLYAASVPMLNRLGESIFLSGMNHYIRSNATLLQAGLTDLVAAPTTFTLAETDPTMTATISEATQLISIAFDEALGWAKETGAAMIISMGIPTIASKNFFNGPYRFADAIMGVDSTGAQSPATVACPFAATELQKVVVRAKIVRKDGRVSNYFRSECFVAS